MENTESGRAGLQNPNFCVFDIYKEKIEHLEGGKQWTSSDSWHVTVKTLVQSLIIVSPSENSPRREELWRLLKIIMVI